MSRIKIDPQQKEGIKIKYAFGQMYEISVPRSYMQDKNKIWCVECWINIYDHLRYMVRLRGMEKHRLLYHQYCKDIIFEINKRGVDINLMIDMANPNKHIKQILDDVMLYLTGCLVSGKEVVE